MWSCRELTAAWVVDYNATRPHSSLRPGRVRPAPAIGYRRLHLLLRREGVEINHKKLFRLYREERLTVRRRGGRKRRMHGCGSAITGGITSCRKDA